MKATIQDKYGNPEDVLYAGEAPIPEPKAGQILIKTGYSVIHNHNISTTRGTYGIKPDLPYIGGTEGAGVVEKVGEGVTNVKVGQRVAVALSITGTWAEYFLANAATAVPVPDSIDDKTAAQITSMPLSAYALLDKLAVKEGDCFIYNGANGLVGIVLAYLAKAKGIKMIKVVRRDTAKQYLEKLGFDSIVVTSDKNWVEKAKELSGEVPVIAAVDNVGGSEGADLLEILSPKGQLVIFGCLSGEPIPSSSRQFIFYDKTISGFWAKTAFEQLPRETLAGYQIDIIKLVASGQIKLPEGGVYGFEDAKEAAKASITSKEGKILFKA